MSVSTVLYLVGKNTFPCHPARLITGEKPRDIGEIMRFVGAPNGGGRREPLIQIRTEESSRPASFGINQPRVDAIDADVARG